MTDKTKLYTVSELARELALTPRAIRHYEDEKLLSPQRAGGNRIFDYRDKARLTLILRLKGVGFSLREIKEYLDLYDVDKTQVTQLKMGFRGLCQRISLVEEQVNELQATLTELSDLRDDAMQRLHDRGIEPESLIDSGDDDLRQVIRNTA